MVSKRHNTLHNNNGTTNLEAEACDTYIYTRIAFVCNTQAKPLGFAIYANCQLRWVAVWPKTQMLVLAYTLSLLIVSLWSACKVNRTGPAITPREAVYIGTQEASRRRHEGAKIDFSISHYR